MIKKIIDIPKDVEIQKQLTNIHIKEWMQNDLFHFGWWLLICLIILSFIVWWIMLDKSRIHEICLFVVLAAIICMGINEWGTELTLWDYPIDIIPIFPPLSSINLIILPLFYSIIYQFFKTKRSFLWATVFGTAVICFVIEPILSLLGLFQLLNWQYFYGFPIYAAMAICIRAAVNKILVITEKYRKKAY